ncbi:MAG: hypothetical protein WBG55_13210 [Pseudoalteromonas rhizosphaerae]|uniref:hypothetical protein n=1 Tax=Pseudoalteromonas rhizosphaerae TaxID=2518973 RepID=UPI003C795D9B
MNEKKVLIILGEAPFVKGDATSNPSVSWLKEYFNGSKMSLIMRGAGDSEQENQKIISLPESKNTLSMIKGLLFSNSHREDFGRVQKVIRQEKNQSSLIWLRAPSLIPLLLSTCWKKKYAEKMYIHICANRLTWAFLKRNFTVANLFKFLNGKLTTLILKKAERSGAKFFHTGNQVQEAFNIKESTYLIDYLPKHYPYNKQREGFVFLGRTSKIQGNAELSRFVKCIPGELNLYGPGESNAIPNGISYQGIVAPELVAKEISQYAVLVCITHEYYEGFPRVLAEAISQDMWVVVNRSCTFFADIKYYPYLIISEDIANVHQLESLLQKRSMQSNNDFKQNIEDKSLING